MEMSNKKDIVSKEIESANKQALLEKYKTSLKKTQFINEIKHGLGEEIKRNPNKVKVIKKSWLDRFKLRLKKMFTKF